MSIGPLAGQLWVQNTDATSRASVAVTSSGATLHNTIAGFIFWSDSVALTGVSGSVNGGYTQAGPTLDDSTGSHYSMAAFFNEDVAAGGEVITASFNAATTQYALFMQEFGNVSLTPSDGYKSAAQATPGTAADGVTTGQSATSQNAKAPALIFSLGFVQAVSLAIGTGFTNLATYPGSAAVGGVFRLQTKRVTIPAVQQKATYQAGGNNFALAILQILDELGATTGGGSGTSRGLRAEQNQGGW